MQAKLNTYNKMTQLQLIEVMKYHLTNFNDEGVSPVDENTIHSTILNANDGVGTAHSKNIYRAVIRWTLRRNGHQDKSWPADWFDNSVDYLSSKIL